MFFFLVKYCAFWLEIMLASLPVVRLQVLQATIMADLFQ